MIAATAQTMPTSTNGTAKPEASAILDKATAPTAPPAAQAAFVAATATAWLEGSAPAASLTIAAVGVHKPDAAELARTVALANTTSEPIAGSKGMIAAANVNPTMTGTSLPTRSAIRPKRMFH